VEGFLSLEIFVVVVEKLVLAYLPVFIKFIKYDQIIKPFFAVGEIITISTKLKTKPQTQANSTQRRLAQK